MGNTIIEINGKRYDARSGDLIGNGQQKPVKPAISQHRGRAIDGFMAPQKPQTQTLAPHHTALKPLPKKQRAPGVHASTPKPQKSQTLMRHAVQKPVKPHKPAAKAQAPAEMVVKKQQLPAPSLKLAAHQVNHPRLSRARRTPQSQQVSRFTREQQNHPSRRTQSATNTAIVQRADYKNTVTRGTAMPSTPKPVRHAQHMAQKPHVDIFEAAIANARSHEQPHHKAKRKPHRKVINIVAGVFAVLLLAGFVTFANKSNIEMRVASIRAGFSAQLPGYAPVGYALSGGVQTKNGAVVTTYRSGESSYTLRQQVSEWDSTTLLDNIVAASSDSYKEIESQGRTIYLYGNDAAWVDGGVLYNIKGDGSITPKEISSIANSM